MKIRNGFVSNSSSSSFVILGVKVTEEFLIEKYGEDYYDEIYKILNKDGIYYVESSENDDHFLGIDIEYKDLSISEMFDMSKVISEKLNVDIKEIKVYSGEKYS